MMILSHASPQRRSALNSVLANKYRKNARKLREGRVPKSVYSTSDRSRLALRLTVSSRNTKLLSFGGDDGDEEGEPPSFKKKPLVRPDCECQTTGFVDCRI